MLNEIYFKPALQIENTGDLLINKAIVDLLDDYGNVILDDSHTPSWFIKEISPSGTHQYLSSVSSDSLLKTIFKRLRKKDKNDKHEIFLVIQPGHTSRKGLKPALWSIKTLVELFILKSFGCKIVRTGFSIGPFDTLNGWLESLTSRTFYHYSVRDKSSLNLAQRYKFHNPKYSPDLAWAYLPNNIENKEMRVYYVLSFRSNSYGDLHDQNYLSPIIESLIEMLKGGMPLTTKIVISYQVKYDRDACLSLHAALSEIFPNVEFLDKKLLLDEAVSLYSGAKCVISNRLHVLLLAMQCNSLALPFVSEVDNRKITSIYKDNGLDSVIIYNSDTLEINRDKFSFAINNTNVIMNKFSTLVAKNTAMIKENLNNVFSAESSL
ncbi:polysaccharide pyruvyl transferase family protein [Pedobacter psychrodurus]|uniref:polysaccharide pyruvyl transferase family protein n=1 Tax=Pedobacter psychrodurus TaxID=2530456 RepID=UPI00292CAAAC|nr:polysaccharide pyruvyl transferase family protein [Pedobacter psychrodurus]